MLAKAIAHKMGMVEEDTVINASHPYALAMPSLLGHEAAELVPREDVRCSLALQAPLVAVHIEDSIAEQIKEAVAKEIALL